MKKNILRQCRGCKNIKNREEMIKITLFDNSLFINPNSKTTGRSVYVCKNAACINNFIKNKGIKRGLKFNNGEIIKETEENLKKILNSP